MKGIWGWIGGPRVEDPLAALAGLGGPDGEPSAGDAASGVGAGGACDSGGDSGGAFWCGPIRVAWAGSPRLSSRPTASGEEIARHLADAGAERGAEAIQDLSGAFALAVLDTARQEAFLAVDRMGIWDLSYGVADGALLFAPRADRIAADPRCRAGEDPQALFDYVYHHMVPRPWTAFRGIFRLRPGEAVTFQKGEARCETYWRPSFPEDRRTSLPAMERGFRDTVRAAVGRASAEGRVGAFLSGGTDSSTVTGMLREVTGQPPATFAIGFDAPGYDETEYARIAARHFGADHHEYYVTPADVVAAVPRIAAGYDQPYGNASVVPSYYCTRLARESGMDTLLGGDGGDELFAGNARYARQWLLSLYSRVPGPVRSGVLEPLTRLPGAERTPPLRKLSSYIAQASLPLPQRLQTYNLLEAMGADHLFTPELLASVRPQRPLEDLSREYRSLEETGLVNRLLALDMKFTLADDDLRKVMGAGDLGGVATRFPFLDDDVVAFAGTVPASLKLRRTQLRYFFKRALRDYLPPDILQKRKQGFGLPFGVWLTTDPALRELAGDSLSGLAGRGIIRPEALDDLLEHRLREHPGHFGTLVWVLMMLEQWFRTRPGPT